MNQSLERERSLQWFPVRQVTDLVMARGSESFLNLLVVTFVRHIYVTVFFTFIYSVCICLCKCLSVKEEGRELR